MGLAEAGAATSRPKGGLTQPAEVEEDEGEWSCGVVVMVVIDSDGRGGEDGAEEARAGARARHLASSQLRGRGFGLKANELHLDGADGTGAVRRRLGRRVRELHFDDLRGGWAAVVLLKLQRRRRGRRVNELDLETVGVGTVRHYYRGFRPSQLYLGGSGGGRAVGGRCVGRRRHRHAWSFRADPEARGSQLHGLLHDS